MNTLPFDDDLKLFALMKEQLYSAVLCDALDQVGFRQQAMRADIRPIYPEAVVVGRALTMQSVDVYHPEENVYDKEIAAVDSLKQGDVMVASTQRSTHTCVWGELLSTAALARGANGAIIDGYTRDVRLIQKMGFPLFATGIHPVDSAGWGEVIDYNCTINCSGVVVSPGDVIFGDYDGVIVVPKGATLRDVFNTRPRPACGRAYSSCRIVKVPVSPNEPRRRKYLLNKVEWT